MRMSPGSVNRPRLRAMWWCDCFLCFRACFRALPPWEGVSNPAARLLCSLHPRQKRRTPAPKTPTHAPIHKQVYRPQLHKQLSHGCEPHPPRRQLHRQALRRQPGPECQHAQSRCVRPSPRVHTSRAIGGPPFIPRTRAYWLRLSRCVHLCLRSVCILRLRIAQA